jgi:hypothetical protein
VTAYYQNPEYCDSHLGDSEHEGLNLVFITLQQNVSTVKTERGVHVVGKEDCTGMKTDEVYKPSQLSICKTEYEVSIILRSFGDGY